MWRLGPCTKLAVLKSPILVSCHWHRPQSPTICKDCNMLVRTSFLFWSNVSAYWHHRDPAMARRRQGVVEDKQFSYMCWCPHESDARPPQLNSSGFVNNAGCDGDGDADPSLEFCLPGPPCLNGHPSLTLIEHGCEDEDCVRGKRP